MNFDLKAIGEKAKGVLKSAGEKAVKAATEVRDRTDRAAAVVAAKVTEVTGRETTAAEVKKAAVMVAGVAVLGTAAVAVASAHRAAAGAVPAAGGGGAKLDFGSDFEDHMARVFAHHGGSVTYVTPRTDPTGTVYYDRRR